jgi:hypothetical protein
MSKLTIRKDESTALLVVRWTPFAVAWDRPKTAHLSIPRTKSAAGDAGVHL